ncbi:tyrosine-type recombinase/integrase [Geothrix paludis]|uniref:tyrosine-type recombinase/integrase n=1 Tax=Geothrix paludis TaxID=2922722 RepID=UPI001FAE3179|nr:site-specific integrase [Geothrix paludis]
MARTQRSGKLDTRTARLSKCPPREEPYWMRLAPGEFLGYYRASSGVAGTWRAKIRESGTGARKKCALGTADDYSDADGAHILDYSQAQAKAREWFTTARQAIGEDAPSSGPYTVADAMEAYRRDCLRRGVKRTDRMESAARLHILPALGALPVVKLSQARIERWHEALAEAAPHVRGRKTSTKPTFGPKPSSEEEKRKRKVSANRVLTVLKSALNLAKRKRRVSCPGDAWREVKPFGKADAPRVRYLTIEEQVRLVNACEPDFRKLVQGGLFTGGRYSELARVEAQDFAPENGTLFIRPGKTGKGRHVVLTEEGAAFLAEAVAGLKGSDLVFTREGFPDMRRVNPETHEVLPKIHRAWKTSDQNRPMRLACEAAGIEPMGFHQLRHSYASALINAGIPLAYVAEVLGHVDTRMVEKHYGHLAPSAVKDSIRKLAPKLGIHQAGNVAGLRIKTGA